MKRTLALISAVILFMLGAAPAYADEAPPAEYTIWDRMPGEDRVQSIAMALKEVPMYSAPRGSTIVGYIKPQEKLFRVSCVVYSKPAAHALRVLKPRRTYIYPSKTPTGPTLQPNTTIYLALYTGEGTYIAWYNGQLLRSLTNINLTGQVYGQDWAQYIGTPTDRGLGIDAWYCMRKADGTVGWVQVYKNGEFDKLFQYVF